MNFFNLTEWIDRAEGRFGRQHEREFLPAALEVLETPPSPTGRAVALLIVAFFAVAVLWATFGRVDILATAPGRVLPAGDVKVIQPLDSGVVRVIHVEDGDHVHKGDLLVELDPTEAGADRDRLQTDLLQARLDVARLTAIKLTFETGRRHDLVAPPADASPARLQEARAGLNAALDQQQAKLSDLHQQISQKSAESAEMRAQLDKLNASIPLLANKEHIHSELNRQGFGTSLAYLDAQQQLSEARHDLSVQSQRETQANDARSALERQADGVRSEFAASTLSDLRKAEEQVNELSQELVKAQDKTGQKTLRAPIDGVVEQVQVHTLGGVVTPAQRLMIVVPDNDRLMVEAQLANRDVGFVHVGEVAHVKVETFNFTRYGLIDGSVVDVSRDVITREEKPPGQGEPAAPEPPRNGSPTYVARVALKASSMMVDGRRENLIPGMAVTAEIRTGSRTILDYLLSPIARKTSESLHER